MSIFTNWIFWVVLSAILFIFALIGFLAEKKKEKVDKESDNSGLNTHNDILNSIDTVDANSFNLESPVQENEGVVSDSTESVQKEISSVSEPTTVQNNILDVSGGLSLGDASTLSDNQDNPSFSNGSLGNNVQMSDVNSLGGDNSAIRNQVNLNPVIESNVETTLQPMTQQINGQISVDNNNGVNELSNVFAGENVQNGNVVDVVAVPENSAINNGVQDLSQPISANNVVNTNETDDNSEKIYDTWS